MNVFAFATMSVLVALAGLHVYWGVGGRWPGTDDRSLVELVVGRTANMRAPGFWACLFVATALLASALLVGLAAVGMSLSLSGGVGAIVPVGFWASFAVFLTRGVAGYVPGVFGCAQGTPFERLNLIVYSPLCLAIAGGYLLSI